MMDKMMKKRQAKTINKNKLSTEISLNDQSLLKLLRNSINSLTFRTISAHPTATMQNIRSDRNNFEMESLLQIKIDLMGSQESAQRGQFAQSGALIQWWQ